MSAENSLTVLAKRYYKRADDGTLLERTPADLWDRVAGAIAEPERVRGQAAYDLKKARYRYMNLAGLFLPNSPCIANAGARSGQCSACFVLPVPDCLIGIFDAVKHTALIHKTGGGTGFSFSRLRPKNDHMTGGGLSSGPLTFMDVINAATESIKQGGMRRGANMGILRVDHPDILDFIAYKDDKTKLTNFNISVALTDVFMRAVEVGTPYQLVNPHTGAITGTLDARTVLQSVVEHAWKTGEPGVIFLDRMNRYCPVPWLGLYEATNPCGEQPLLPYESCNLGSINLEKLVMAEGPARIDWHALRTLVWDALEYLDDVVSINQFPLPELKTMSDATRKVGLGVMGFARLLMKLGIRYGSREALLLSRQLASYIDYHAKLKSIKLAELHGPFPAMVGHEEDFYAYFDMVCDERQAEPGRHPDADYASLKGLVRRHGIRNSNQTTEAPTGTLSIIADCSAGIEPVFALAFKRFQADAHMLEADPIFEADVRALGLDDIQMAALWAAIDDNHGTLHGLDLAGYGLTDPTQIARLHDLYVSAHDLTPSEHVHTQAAWQAFNDSAISKTINFGEDATASDVAEAYQLAYSLGCKGITIYRNNSRAEQPLSVKSAPVVTQATPQPGPDRVEATAGRDRPEDLYGFSRKLDTGEGSLLVTVNYDAEGPREVVATIGRSGGTLHSCGEAIGRLISLCLKFRVPHTLVAKALVGIRGANPHGYGSNAVLSIPDTIGKVLMSAPASLGEVLAHQPSGLPVPLVPAGSVTGGADYLDSTQEAVRVYGKSPECSECGGRIQYVGSCATCTSCGKSSCV